MFTFTALLGARTSSTASSSLLELDNGIKILADVGWDSSFDHEQLEAVANHASTLSIILLTHATIEHLGAYAHCCKHVAGFNKIPTYATTPVINLGRTLTSDLYQSAPPGANLLPKHAFGSALQDSEASNIILPSPTQEEITGFFGRIHPLKYSQPHQPVPSPFSPPLSGLTVTAYGAGHTLGGTIWHIQYGMESIVYAADWNQTKENLFDGARMLETGGDEVIEPLQRPTAFVCSSRGVTRTDVLVPKKRDEQLISAVREAIAQGGKVLIPTDSSARLLELAFVLNATWRENINGPHAAMYKNTKIYMATRSSKATLRYVQSMLEWLEPGVAQEGEAAMTTQGGAHPLHWDHVKRIERKTQVDRALAKRRPTIVLASDASLEWGFSGQAIQSWAADERNLIILTEQSPGLDGRNNRLSQQLWDFYRSQDGTVSAQSNVKLVDTSGKKFTLREASTTDLTQEETSVYQQYLARQLQLHSSLQGDNTLDDAATTAIGEEQVEDSSDSEDEDEDAEHQGRALNISLQMTQNKRKVGLSDAELGVNVLLKGKNIHDYDVRNKRGREKMFPFVAHRNRADEFGELIKPEDYLRAEERDDVGGIDMRGDQKVDSTAVPGQKRKWDDSNGLKQKKDVSKPLKKTKADVKSDAKQHEPDYYDEVIARATGEILNNGGTTSAPGANGSAPDAESSGSEDESEDGESEYEPDDEGPQKVVFTTAELSLRMKIAHVDFSGLAALTDIVNIVSMMRPRKLILSAGTEEEIRTLAEKCKPIPEMANAEILTPAVGQSVEASMDTNAWTLKLTPELVRRLEWQTTDIRGGEMRIASVSGLLAPPKQADEEEDKEAEDESSAKKKRKTKLAGGARSAPEPDAETSSLPLLTIPPLVTTTAASAAIAAQPVRVGELRILDLRAHLAALGHNVVVRGQGTLLVDGSVVIRKIPATGRLEVECANTGFARAPGRTIRILPGASGEPRQVLDLRGVFFGVREEVERALATVR